MSRAELELDSLEAEVQPELDDSLPHLKDF